jgi:glycine dehydrogenase subunit 2
MMIEPTESESREELDLLIDALKQIAKEAEENPELVATSPHTTRLRRLDETTAARKPVLRWKPVPNGTADATALTPDSAAKEW